MSKISLVISGFPIEFRDKAFEIISKDKWSEIREKNGMVFCKNNWQWNWDYSNERVKDWNSFMYNLEELYGDSDFFTIVISEEDFSLDIDSSLNIHVASHYGFGTSVNTVGEIFG